MSSQHTKHQHYIPVFYLKNWCNIDKNRDSKLWFYMIKTKQIGQPTIDSICYQNNLYECNLPDNLIENSLSTFWEPIWKYMIDKILKHEDLTDIELSGICIMIAHFLLRTPYFIKNLPQNLSISKDTYLLNSVTLVTEKGQISEEYNQILTVFSQHILNTYKYVYFGYTNKTFVINDFISVVINNCRNPKDTKFENQDLYFPISSNMCVIVTNKDFEVNDRYVLLENDYVDWINTQYITMNDIRFIYSKDDEHEYIENILKCKEV